MACLLAALSLLVSAATCFSCTGPARGGRPRTSPHMAAAEPQQRAVSVADLGLTMDDLLVPFPQDLVQEMVATGYDSTAKNPINADMGAVWSESQGEIEVKLTIPGLRGQPAACMAVEATETSLTVLAFGRAVWSCILQGRIQPKTAQHSAAEAMGSPPVISFSANKASAGLWGGFVKSIGEDSLL